MKQSFKIILLNVCAASMLIMASCKKEVSDNAAEEFDTLQAAITATQAIAVTGSADGDSVYITGTCDRNSHRDSMAASALPAAVSSYLSANYSGYTFTKAFKVSDASNNVQGYVVVINYNGNPVGLKFDASGTFVKVLEQREGRDLLGRGFREGGRFEHRDGKQRDTVALNALPAAIKNYFAATYPSDTLLCAAKIKNAGYIVLSKNNGLFANAFDLSGNFVGRIALPVINGKITEVEAAGLPAAVKTYLSNTYPGYVLNKAFSISINGALQGYCLVIEANSTKYGLLFNAAGNFVAVKVIR